VVEETFAVYDCRTKGFLLLPSRWDRDGHTTMSNFNLRLLPTFSFIHRSLGEGGLVPPLSTSHLFLMPALPPVGGFGEVSEVPTVN